MKVIVPTNNKGGVGKTKLSVLIAEYFAIVERKRVFFIDFDPQCNSSKRFIAMEIDPATPDGKMPPIHPDYDPTDMEMVDWDGRSSIADIFFGSPVGVLPYSTPIQNLDIAPGHAGKLLLAEAVRRSEVVEKVHNQLKIFLSVNDLHNLYDVVVIDTAPSKGPLTIAAVKAATHILIPSVMEEYSIEGVYGMMQLWMQESFNRSSDEPPLKLIGILPNMVRRTSLHRDMLQSLKENEWISKYVLPVQLSQRTIFAELDTEGAHPKTVFDLQDDDPAKIEAMESCQLIAKKVFNDE